jgi:CofD-related protein of GAK system
MHVKITHSIHLPELRRLELYRRSPELGPKILFFTGGSALKKVSEELIYYTHNSIHIIPSVDSGGSSAGLRDAFKMPAIGDIRNRLMALADRGLTGNAEIFRLFTFRFPEDGDRQDLYDQLIKLIQGTHPLVARIDNPMRRIIRLLISRFENAMPTDFDLRGACVGNLILTGGYLDGRHHLAPIIYIFSKLVNVCGAVESMVESYLHLVAELENGERIVGQHLITGKEAEPITAGIKNLYFTDQVDGGQPVEVAVPGKIRRLIKTADLICYPMGSFFSSIVANLLPAEVGDIIAMNPRLKVFVPNTGNDPELCGMDMMDQVETLLRYLKQGAHSEIADADLLNLILIDERHGIYPGELDDAALRKRGIQVIGCKMITTRSQPYIDEKLLVPILLSLS